MILEKYKLARYLCVLCCQLLMPYYENVLLKFYITRCDMGLVGPLKLTQRKLK